MKGAYPAEEIAALPPSIEVVAAPKLRVPGLDAETAFDRNASTRAAGMTRIIAVANRRAASARRRRRSIWRRV